MEKEIINKEFSINNISDEKRQITDVEEQNMTRQYYRTWREAYIKRRKYDRIYFDEEKKMYYIVRVPPKGKNFWERYIESKR